MTIVVALLLAAGVLLVASPWLWPRRPHTASDARPATPGRLAELLARAGLPTVRPAVLIATMVVLGVIGAGLVLLLVPVLALAPAAAVVCAVTPLLLLRARAASRRRALRALWPDVVDLLLSSIRAGRGLPDALSALADSAPEAVRPAFVGFRRDWLRTARFDDSLTLRTTLADFGKASFWFEYEVSRDGETVATGRTRHGCIEISTGRPSRVPDEFVARLSEAAS